MMDPTALDDLGTHHEDGSRMLRILLNDAFDGNESDLALAIGRPEEDVKTLLGTEGIFDEDLVSKIRGIAIHRGVSVDENVEKVQQLGQTG